MDAERALLPLTRRETVRVVVWGALDGFAIGAIAASLANLAIGASADVTTLVRLIGPLGALVGAVVARIRVPAMGVIVDGDGVELHGLALTRRIPWGAVAQLGPSKPGRRFTVGLRGGRQRRGPGRFPRRVPDPLRRLAAAHDVPLLPFGTLKSGAEPTIREGSPGR